MTGRALAAALQRLLVGVVLVLSGGYMLVYLYRWEWNRAIISGLFFVAAEVALAAGMILRRLRALEARPAAAPDPAPATLFEQLRSVEGERPNPFRWLNPADPKLSVLVPVLLGAGVVLSGIAYVVERIAEVTAAPAFDRRVAARLAVMAPPPGGLLAGPVGRGPQPFANGRPPGPVIRAAVVLATIGVLGWIGVNGLAEAAQSRPDPADRPAQTAIELAVAQRGQVPPAAVTADALWVACRSTLGSLPVEADVVGQGDDRAVLVLRPGIGRLGIRRLTGCLADARLDLTRADVLSVTSTPSAQEER